MEPGTKDCSRLATPQILIWFSHLLTVSSIPNAHSFCTLSSTFQERKSYWFTSFFFIPAHVKAVWEDCLFWSQVISQWPGQWFFLRPAEGSPESRWLWAKDFQLKENVKHSRPMTAHLQNIHLPSQLWFSVFQSSRHMRKLNCTQCTCSHQGDKQRHVLCTVTTYTVVFQHQAHDVLMILPSFLLQPFLGVSS